MAHFTKHARQRSAQRSIPETAVDLILDYGDIQRMQGADSYFFSSPAKRRLRREIGQDGVRRVRRYLRVYAIVSDDGRVITVARNNRQIRRR
jgi:hypothetical protein